jgi:hypothetical protein
MSEDVAARLRSLAKDYSHGRVDFEAYRRTRTALLDSLISKTLDESRSEALSLPLSSSDALPPAVPEGHAAAPWRRSRAHWIGAVALLLIALVVGDLLIRGRSEPDAGRETKVASDRIFELVSPLMTDPDWSDAHVTAVNAALLEEGSRQIALRQQTVWFQRFAAEVRRRLGEQSALRRDGLAPEKSSLAALAVTIGLDPMAPQAPLRPPIRGSSAAESPPDSSSATK